MSQKISQLEVKQLFQNNGCELLDIYKNNRTPLKYKCICGNISKICLTSFRNGSRCKACKVKVLKQKFKFDYNYVFNIFKNAGCELISNEYINNSTPLEYVCQCGEISSIRLSEFQQGRRCKHCGIKKRSETQSFNFDYVKQYYEDNNCILLSKKYINSSHPMNWICPLGHNMTSSFSSFKKGHRCKECQRLSFIGENNPNWIEDRESLKVIQKLRKTFGVNWGLKYMVEDPRYKEYKQNPKIYNIDHIIPIKAFAKIMLEKDLDEMKIKEIANHRRNLQILSEKDNLKKKAKYNTQELNNYITQYYY